MPALTSISVVNDQVSVRVIRKQKIQTVSREFFKILSPPIAGHPSPFSHVGIDHDPKGDYGMREQFDVVFPEKQSRRRICPSSPNKTICLSQLFFRS
jgi:hypothetical protein